MPVAANIYYHLSKFGYGDHLPVVLIHGAGGSHLYWPPEIRRLPELRVYAIDLPGHGKSEQRGLQQIQTYAESILTWMIEIGLHRAAFVGHSMGGAIALTLAKNHADRVLGLSLISTGARLRVAPAILDNSANPQSFPTAVSIIITKAFSSKANPRLVELARERMNKIRPSVLHGDFIACNNFDMLESLSTIKQPTLIVGGENDELVPLRYHHYLSDHIPGAQIQVIPNAGHMVMLEQPQSVAKALKKFLSAIPFRPGGF